MEKAEITAYAQEVAKVLGETEEKPLKQIELIIEHMGRDFVAKYLEETEKIEEKGGMKTEDKKRRRTKGGVFFYIVKGKLSDDVRQIIFPGYGQQQKGRTLEWDERHEHIEALKNQEEQGVATHTFMTVQGRPGKVLEWDNTIMAIMPAEEKSSPLPRGVPTPPDQPATFIVYMGIRHWNDVREMLERYKKDRLIAEGVCHWDAETETYAVFAHKVTTKRLQKLARQENESDDAAGEEQAPDKADTDSIPAVKAAAPPAAAQAPRASAAKAAPAKAPQGSNPTASPSDKLQQLYSAAETLRAKIVEMEANGQPGIGMTKRLLRNTEKQIEVLERQATK